MKARSVRGQFDVVEDGEGSSLERAERVTKPESGRLHVTCMDASRDEAY